MRIFVPAAFAALVLSTPLAAQQQQAPPPLVAVSAYVCDMNADLEVAVDVWSKAFAQLQQDGKILGWGVLQHAWADEWNLMVYRTVQDLVQLQASLEAQGPAMEAAGATDDMLAACSMHKDNIYFLRAAGSTPPPTGGGR